MISFGKRSSGNQRRRALGDLGEKALYYKGEWMETGDDPILSPTVFLIEQPAGSSIPTHFHRQNEFQVVVHGSGSIGQHALSPISIHYAGAYTGYGPVTAGEEGLAYFTIRPAFDNAGAITIERAKKELVRGPKRQAYARHLTPATPDEMRGLRQPVREHLLAERHNDLSVELLRIPAGQSAIVLQAEKGCGVFHMIVSGEVECRGERLALWEFAFISPEGDETAVMAGAAGAQVVSMQMPHTAEPYRRSRTDAAPATANAQSGK
jgi:hypothetical protein